MLKKALLTAVLGAALLPGAAAAKSPVLHYKGKTREGTRIQFVLDRGWLDRFEASLPTTCISAQGGTPRVTFTEWAAPFKYRPGARVAFDHGDPTQHYHLISHRRRGNRIEGKLEINYSQLNTSYDTGYYVEHCLATANFSLKPR